MIEGELLDAAQPELQLWDARIVFVRGLKVVGGAFSVTACLAAPALADAVLAARACCASASASGASGGGGAALLEVAQAEAVMAALQAPAPGAAAPGAPPPHAALAVQLHHDLIAALAPALTPQRYAAFRAWPKAERASAAYEAEQSSVANTLAELEARLFALPAGFRVRVDLGLLGAREEGGGSGEGGGGGGGAGIQSFPHGAVTVIKA